MRKYTGGGEGARKWLTMEGRIRSYLEVEVKRKKKGLGGSKKILVVAKDWSP